MLKGWGVAEEVMAVLVLGKFGLVWFRAIFARPETRLSGP